MSDALSIIHVVRDLRLTSGGPSRSVPLLAMNQAQLDHVETSLFFTKTMDAESELARPPVQVFPISEGLVAWRRQLRTTIAESGTGGRVLVHIHGLWSVESMLGIMAASAAGLPYVISTRGMLAPWALRHKSMKKKLALWLYQARAIRGASLLLASSEEEHADVKKLFPDSRVEILPNGIELPEAMPTCRQSRPDSRLAVAIGRLHPVKGYAELIRAWSRCRPPDWQLSIAGPDEDGYGLVLQRLIESEGVAQSVRLIGAVDETAKWQLLADAEVLFAPSHTENFGMAIAEALIAGVPVVTTTKTPWKAIGREQCGWQIEPGQKALEDLLPICTSNCTEDLREMGERGHRFVKENFSWPRIAARSIELYYTVIESHPHKIPAT